VDNIRSSAARNNPSVSLTADSSAISKGLLAFCCALWMANIFVSFRLHSLGQTVPLRGRLLKQALKQFALVPSGYMRNPAVPGLLYTREPSGTLFAEPFFPGEDRARQKAEAGAVILPRAAPACVYLIFLKV
jgi:hypothetical protein